MLFTKEEDLQKLKLVSCKYLFVTVQIMSLYASIQLVTILSICRTLPFMGSFKILKCTFLSPFFGYTFRVGPFRLNVWFQDFSVIFPSSVNVMLLNVRYSVDYPFTMNNRSLSKETVHTISHSQALPLFLTQTHPTFNRGGTTFEH